METLHVAPLMAKEFPHPIQRRSSDGKPNESIRGVH